MSTTPTVIVVERTRTATVQPDPDQPSVVTKDDQTGIVTAERDSQAVETPEHTGPKTVLSYRGPQGEQGEVGPPGPPGQDGAVMSVNAQIGDVVLDYDDVGADPMGAALSAATSTMALHKADPDPHPQYIDANDVLDGGNF